tara:strand:+ start:732 stop:959 length:228 start_codon:yes stop_codon:yes gene_type:complete
MTSPNVLGTSISDKQLAERWGVSLRTLRTWRRAGTGPPWVKIRQLPKQLYLQGSIRYPLADLLAYELTHEITPLN